MNFEDLSGKRFGRFVVLKLGGKRPNIKTTFWTCQCDCGNVKDVMSSSLKNGDSKSCGCLRKQLLFKDLSGKRFGRLIVVKLDRIDDKGTFYECKCDCGNIKSIRANCLKGGGTKSCGCLNQEARHRPHKTKIELENSIFKRYIRNIMQGKNTSRRRKDMPVTITVQDLRNQWIKQRGICPYTGWGINLREKTGHTTPCQASLDRIDPSRGYLPDNIQFVALMANYAKNFFDDEHLIYFCKSVAQKYSNVRVVKEDEMKRIEQSISSLEACLSTSE